MDDIFVACFTKFVVLYHILSMFIIHSALLILIFIYLDIKYSQSFCHLFHKFDSPYMLNINISEFILCFGLYKYIVNEFVLHSILVVTWYYFFGIDNLEICIFMYIIYSLTTIAFNTVPLLHKIKPRIYHHSSNNNDINML